MLNTENIQSLIDSGEGYNVEFKVRVPSKVRELTEEICAFANADGGYLLIGVDDNGQVVDTNLENDKRSAIQGSISEISPALHCELYSVNIVNKTVWVIDVPSGKDKPYIFSGSIYVREGANSQKLRTAEEMRSFFQECNKIFFDHIPCHWFNIYTDADEQMIKDFRTEAKLSPSTPDKQIFENLELFTENGTAKNGAAMFFGKQPERKFPHAVTRLSLIHIYFSRWSQFLRYQLKAKNYDRDKEQNGRSPGKKPDRQAEPGSQHEADRVTVLRNQKASRRNRAVRQLSLIHIYI